VDNSIFDTYKLVLIDGLNVIFYALANYLGVYMPTASITLPGGAKVVIEGTQAEVVELIAKFQGDSPPLAKGPERSPMKAATKRAGPLRLIGDLIDADFFKSPQELGAVRMALEAQGHFYPTTSLSPLMLRLVRGKQLRRIKTLKRWTYVR
jgi:hypothetical protein